MYMITHKKVDYIPNHRTPLFVGHGKNENNYIRDNTFDNIASLNPYFCELTGLYWIWKNDHTSEFVSIEHYRRFFFSTPFNPIKYNKMYKKVSKYGIIATKKYKHSLTNIEYYAKHHYGQDFDVIYNIIKDIYPEYIDDYDFVMNSRQSSMLNMICCKKEIFDSYCEWLFSILFKAEQIISYKERDSYQQRVFGFLSERLLNVWLHHNYNGYKTLGVYLLKDSKLKSSLYTIKDSFM